MNLRNLLIPFFLLAATASSQTLTVISGNGQLARLGSGVGGGPITVQLLNGATPVPNATVVFSNPSRPTSIPVSPTSIVTNSAGEGTVTFTPAFLQSANFETYTLVATSGAASVTFYEAASQLPVTVDIVESAPNVLYPVKATAGQPASFYFLTSITGALPNVSTQIVPVGIGTPPPGTIIQTAHCLEGANNPGGVVYSNANAQAVCTPVFNVPNSALNPAYNTFTFDVVVGGAFTFGPFSYNISAVPLNASLASTMVLAQINTPISIPITVSGGVPPYTFTPQGGTVVLPPGLTLGSNGVISGTPTTSGTYPVTIVITDTGGETKTIGPLTIGVSSGPFAVTPASLPPATLGILYSQILQVTGGVAPYTWTLGAALPTGLTAALGDSTGDTLVIAGTPKAVQSVNFSILIKDSFGEQYAVPVIYTLAVDNPITFGSMVFPIATVGAAYSDPITVAGGSAPFTVATTTLPPGLVLTNGTITGVPTTSGVYPVTVTVTDSQGLTNMFTASLAVSTGMFTYPSKVTLPAAVQGVAYSTQLPLPSGGVPPYTFAFSGTAPAGLTLTAGGVLTTTPTLAGAEPFTIVVQDSATETIAVPLSLTVNTTLPTINALVNAASFSANPPAPGELVALFGTNIGPATGTGLILVNGAVPPMLAGVQVSFGSIPAPVLYVSATQVNVVVPFGVVPGSTVPVSISYGGSTSTAFPQLIGLADPGVFLFSGTQGAILDSDSSINGATNPASAGQFIQIYGTGAGPFTPAVIDGELPTTPSSPSVANVSVTIGGVPATVLYAGVAPGEVAGVFQLNVLLPSGITPGPDVPVVVTIGTASSSAESVTVAIN